MHEKLRARIAEWMLVRKTATLGDLVDEAMFADMCGVKVKTLRDWRSIGAAYSLVVPDPIFRPEGLKPIWLRSEAEKFAREMRGKKQTRGRR